MYGYLTQSPIIALIALTTFLLAITFHEFAHAWSAYLLGDDTAKRFGRLTLNPLAHIDPVGLFCLLFFRIGWARPVPMDPGNFKYPRLYAMLSGLAGPLSNFLLALFFLYGVKLVSPAYMMQPPPHYFLEFFKLAAWINVMLGTFNLLPIPPLDGSHILHALIPPQWEYVYYKFQRYSIFILLILLLLPPFQNFLMNAIITVDNFLKRLVM